MENRKLTGRWYIKPSLFGHTIYVEVVIEHAHTYFVKATHEDLLTLGLLNINQ